MKYVVAKTKADNSIVVIGEYTSKAEAEKAKAKSSFAFIITVKE